MAAGAPPPFDPNEPLQLHDPVPDFGDFSGAYTAPSFYLPEIHPCQTCTRSVSTHFHLAPVVVEEGPKGEFIVKHFYNPALNTFRQVNAMLAGEHFTNVGTSAARSSGEGGILIVKYACFRAVDYISRTTSRTSLTLKHRLINMV